MILKYKRHIFNFIYIVLHKFYALSVSLERGWVPLVGMLGCVAIFLKSQVEFSLCVCLVDIKNQLVDPCLSLNLRDSADFSARPTGIPTWLGVPESTHKSSQMHLTHLLPGIIVVEGVVFGFATGIEWLTQTKLQGGFSFPFLRWDILEECAYRSVDCGWRGVQVRWIVVYILEFMDRIIFSLWLKIDFCVNLIRLRASYKKIIIFIMRSDALGDGHCT